MDMKCEEKKMQIKEYKKLESLRTAAHDMRVSFKIKGDANKEFALGRKYALKNLHVYRDMKTNFGNDVTNQVINLYSSTCGEISKTRSLLRRYEYQRTPIKEATVLSVEKSLMTLNMLFPKSHWSVNVDKDICFSPGLSAYHDNVVGVKITWLKKVFLKGIHRVKAGDGMRFILDADEMNSPRLLAEGIKVFKVKSLKYKKKTGSVNDAWVMKYDYNYGDQITAIHEELGRAESLINRRIKSKVEQLLLK